MAIYPTAGASDGTWGTECSAYHAVSTDLATGKVKDGAVQVSSGPPTEDAAVANKKYVDDIGIKAWIRIDGSDGSKLAGSSNVTAARSGTGTYSLTFSPAMTDANYVVSMSASRVAGGATTMLVATQDVATPVHTTIAFNLNTTDLDKAFRDAVAIDVMIMGN